MNSCQNEGGGIFHFVAHPNFCFDLFEKVHHPVCIRLSRSFLTEFGRFSIWTIRHFKWTTHHERSYNRLCQLTQDAKRHHQRFNQLNYMHNLRVKVYLNGTLFFLWQTIVGPVIYSQRMYTLNHRDNFIHYFWMWYQCNGLTTDGSFYHQDQPENLSILSTTIKESKMSPESALTIWHDEILNVTSF